MSALTVGGQCEGYGGIFQALQQHLDVEHAWYAEVNEAASKVLAHHYPGVPNHGDITAYDWSTAERVDIFTSGFPCQGFSLAGKRRGSDDERHLWPTGVLPAIRELMPPLVVLENVPGLLTIENGQVFAKILADLDGLGYTVSWTVVGACRVGACHHRHRVFIAATLAQVRAPMSDPIAHRSGDGWGPAQFVLFGDAEAVRWPASGITVGATAWELNVDTCGAGEDVLPTPRTSNTKSTRAMTASRENGRRSGGGQSSPPGLEEVVAVLAGHWPDHMPAWEDLPPASQAMLPTPRTSDTNGAGQHGNGGLDLRTAVSMLPTPLANDHKARSSPGDLRAKSPGLEAVFAMLPTPIAGDSERGSLAYSRGNPTLIGSLLPTPPVADSRGTRNATAGRSATASTKVNAGWTLGDVVYDGQIRSIQPERFGKYAAAVHRHEIGYGLAAPDPTEPGRNGKPRLSPAFPEFMQGLPPGWLTDVVDRKDALKLAGNGVNPRQAAYALSTLPTFQAAVKALARVEVAA